MNLIDVDNINLLQFNLFPGERLFHFSTTIQGGVSEGSYATFNLGFYSGDNPENVHENRYRLESAADVEHGNLFIPYQTHSDKICIIDEAFLSLKDNDRYLKLNEVDAVITDRKGVCIGVTTADCVPVLVYDPVKNILAAAHAGWKGTVTKIVHKTILAMMAHFGCDPRSLLAGIGPCISQKHFEVGDEVIDIFQNAGFLIDAIAYRNDDSGKMHIDLEKTNKMILTESGVLPKNIELAGLCTYSNPGLFFSARRQTIHSGRMITGGVLR